LGGIPPLCRNQRAPTGGDTRHDRAASSLDKPSAIAFQNCCRFLRSDTDGRPGERIFARAARSDFLRRFLFFIALLAFEVLRRPLEFTPYASEDYRQALAERGMIASMSRKGDCWDNAVAESFFATLRVELVDDERYVTPSAAEVSIGDYIERFYNTERLHSHLDYVSPIEFELKARMFVKTA